MYFDHHFYHQVLNGVQTQITHPQTILQHFDPYEKVVTGVGGALITYVGNLEPVQVQQGRETFTVGTIRLTDIRQMRLYDLTDDDALAEGCQHWYDFTAYWILRHGNFQRETPVLVYSFVLVESFAHTLRKLA